ncbi:hypothetical protein GCM10027169_05190 [Gordonia jinhuaensis]
MGPDVSSWQHTGGALINWGAVRAAGQHMAMVKATESDWYVNPYYVPDAVGVKASGLMLGTYHYADPSKPAAAQALFYAGVALGQRGPQTLPPVLDLESSGGLSPAGLAAWLREYFATLEGITGRKTIIYTYPTFWNTAMAGSSAFTDHPLWIASYNGGSAPTLPRGWGGWTFWQYTDNGRLPGIKGGVDLNAYNGTIPSLYAMGNNIGGLSSGSLGSAGSSS